MKNNSELNEFIERLDRSLDDEFIKEHTYCPVQDIAKAARILHEIATNPDIKVVRKDDPEGYVRNSDFWKFYNELPNIPDALDDLIGGV